MRRSIGITAADPGGIGLEVVLKSISTAPTSVRWILFTDRSFFDRNAALFPPGVKCHWIDSISSAGDEPALFLRDLGGDASSIHFGQLSHKAGERALAYLKAASDEALQVRLQAIVTAPVSKEAIGGTFHGQTD